MSSWNTAKGFSGFSSSLGRVLIMQGIRQKGCAYTVSGVCQLYPLMMKC